MVFLAFRKLAAVVVAALTFSLAPVAHAEQMSFGVFATAQPLFDVETALGWGGGIDVNFGMTYFKFLLAFSDYYWDTDLVYGFGPTFEFGKLLAVPVRLGGLFKFIYHTPGTEIPEGTLYPKGVANTEAVSALGVELGTAAELKLGKRKSDSPRAFVGADFQLFNGFRYMSTHDVGWLTAVNINVGMRFF